jgi:transposase-like protein
LCLFCSLKLEKLRAVFPLKQVSLVAEIPVTSGGRGRQEMADVCFSAQLAPTADGSGRDETLPAVNQHAAPKKGRQTRFLDSPSTTRPTRRRFTAEYKLQILLEADQCTKPGELRVVLQREGLYSSHLCAWRRQREAGALAALAPKKRGRKPVRNDSLARENQLLLCENEHLLARLHQAETIIAMQTKVSDVLGIPLTTPGEPATPLESSADTLGGTR